VPPDIGQFQQDAKFSTRMTRIVMNRCLMRLRRARRAQFLYLDEIQMGENRGALALAAGGETPEEELGRKQAAAVLAREIRRIPPLLRHALVLRHVQELAMRQIAKRLGITVGSPASCARYHGRISRGARRSRPSQSAAR
jgi:RNA polymerase sigma factor (sigma-70 family)